jgi:hypothetical protein
VFKCAGISMNQVKRKLFSLSLKGRAAEWYKMLKDGGLLAGRKLYLSFILNSILLVRFIKIGLLELCPRGNNKDVIIIILVHDNVYIPC